VRLAAVVTALAVAASGAAAGHQEAAEVTTPGKLFAPRDVDVLVGTSVTWRNVDTATHTVTEDDDVFDSGHIRPGGSFSETFSEPGAFAYHCSIHRFMRGTVHVFEVVLRGPPEPLRPGRRARLEGLAPAGVGEVVLERLSPGPAAVVGRASPGTGGAFVFTVRSREPERYRARAGSATSPVVRVAVEPRVAVASRTRGIAVSAFPARPGSRVLLQEYDRESFDFVTVARGRLDRSSHATIAYRPTARTQVRAVVRGSQGWSDGVSRTISVRPR
jgi:plastocyanin